jgi:hypothetical protein
MGCLHPPNYVDLNVSLSVLAPLKKIEQMWCHLKKKILGQVLQKKLNKCGIQRKLI